MQEQVISAVTLPGKTARAQLAQDAVTQAVEELVRQLTAATAPQPSPEGQRLRRPYTVKQVSYLIPSCDGCGLSWSFFDAACVDGIPPHFTDQGAALEQLPRDYGWQVRSCRFGRPLMACRTCAAAGVIPAGAFGDGRWPRRAGWAAGAVRPRRPLLPGPGPGHPESLTAELPPQDKELRAAIDDENFPRP